MNRVLLNVFVLIALVGVLCVSDIARSAPSYSKTVQLIAGKADTVELSGPVADVLVANPAIADVGTLRSNRLYIIGKTIGDTNILAYDEVGNELANITVQVRTDDRSLQDSIKEFFPHEKVTVRTVRNNVILSGRVSSPAVSNQIRDLAARFLADTRQTLVDLMKVDSEQQVMLKVKVVEASRNALRELGIQGNVRTGGATDTDQTSIVPGAAGSPIGSGATDGTRLFTNDVGRTVLLPFGSGMITTGSLTTIINALERNGIVNTLAEPNLTAISGETAGFLAGGEFPVPAGRDSSGNVTIEFKQFGVALNFTPTVLNRERIALHLSTEVSEQDTSVSVTLANVQIPGLSVRRAETTVELGSGSTIMIAGLLKSNTLQTINGYPGVQNLPIIGQLLKSRSFQRNETELLFIITPYLVNSYAEGDAVAVETPPASLPAVPPPMPQTAKTLPADKPSVVIPEKTGKVEPLPQAKPAPAVAKVTPPKMPSAVLSQTYMAGLRKSYGNKIVDKVGSSAGFGYIVE